MTERIEIVGTLVAADAKSRTITGRVLPYGEVGYTNLGRIIASTGCVEVAADVTLNLEHEPTRPLGRMIATNEADDGLYMTFKVARTSAGNDLLAEADDRLRTGLSVEVDNPTVDGKGHLLGGLLTAVGAVVRPAFDTARITEMVATMAPQPDALTAASIDISPSTTVAEIIQSVDPEEVVESVTDEAPAEASEPVAASAASHPAPARRVVATAAKPVKGKALATMKATIGDALKRRDFQLLASISNVTNTGIDNDNSNGQWLGELWDGKRYQRTVVPLLDNTSLTDWDVKGWRFTATPDVDTYSGDVSEVPSGAVTTEQYSVSAARLAAGNKFDRKFLDFNDTDFLTGYFEAMTDSYARKTDALAVDFLQASATPVTPGAVPTGIGVTAGALIDGALGVLDKGSPTFAVVDAGAYRSLLMTPRDSVLEYLSMSLGLEDGTLDGFKIVPRKDLLPGQVIVGIKQAARFMELPGSPIRVNALDLLNGAFDEAVFGYYAEVLDDAEGLATVTMVPTAAVISTGAFALTTSDPDKELTIRATYADGSTIDIPSTSSAVTLHSATPAKATVVGGKIHPVAAGTSNITADFGGITTVAVVCTVS